MAEQQTRTDTQAHGRQMGRQITQANWLVKHVQMC
jgi:hypothetical protein